MRKFLVAIAILSFVLAAIGAAVAFGFHVAGSMDTVTVTVDGETFRGPAVAAALGGAAAVGVVLVCLLAVAVLASVAIVVPVVLALVALAILVALVVGLAPVLVPVLLLAGAYVLLSRRAKRRRSAAPPSLPVSPSGPNSYPAA